LYRCITDDRGGSSAHRSHEVARRGRKSDVKTAHDMSYAMVERADGNGAEVGGVSQQVMDQFSSRARAIDGRLRTWVDQYMAKHGKPPSRRTIYLMGQEIAKHTRRPKAEARRMAGGKVSHVVTDEERLKAWEDQTTSDELQVLSAVHAEAKAYARCSARPLELTDADEARAARIAVAEAQYVGDLGPVPGDPPGPARRRHPGRHHRGGHSGHLRHRRRGGRAGEPGTGPDGRQLPRDPRIRRAVHLAQAEHPALVRPQPPQLGRPGD
jgi:hypothetical protein